MQDVTADIVQYHPVSTLGLPDHDIEVVAKNDCVLVDLNSEEAEVSVFGDAKPIELEEAVFEKSAHICLKKRKIGNGSLLVPILHPWL